MKCGTGSVKEQPMNRRYATFYITLLLPRRFLLPPLVSLDSSSCTSKKHLPSLFYLKGAFCLQFEIPRKVAGDNFFSAEKEFEDRLKILVRRLPNGYQRHAEE